MAQTGHWIGHGFDKAFNGQINWLTDTLNLMLLSSGWTPSQVRDYTVGDIRAYEIANGNGYATNGMALATKTVVYVDANVPGTSWTGGMTATASEIIQGTSGGSGYIFKCTTPGTAGGSTPSWNTTMYGTTSDGGTVVWTCVGQIAAARAVQAYVLNDIIRDGSGHLFRCVVPATTSGGAPSYLTTYLGQLTVDGSVTWQYVGFGQTILMAATVTWASSTITANYAVLADYGTGSDATRPLVAYSDFGGSLASTNSTFAVQWDPHGIMPIYLS